MTTGIPKVQGNKVVGNDGEPVILRGAALAGWMNMENFITGYPAHEHQHRASMLKVLGQEKYDFFFEKFLEYFFTEKDAAFFASTGLNCLRLPFNYRHFEDDMSPRVLKPDGFKHLDRVIDLCAKYKIYTILDLHALPGGQNPDWHSDNRSNYAAFWDHKDFQDRVIWLWREIASRYKDNAWVAGYNLINEPCDPLHYRLPQFYDRIEKEVRAVDPDHILWLDGNTFSMEFREFTHVLPNTVYGLHDYATMGFPTGPRYTGAPSQNQQLESQFLRKASFMLSHKTPIWNGEFGPVYANPSTSSPSTLSQESEINASRLALLTAQLKIYSAHNIHWTIWLYKDIGLQGLLSPSQTSPWLSRISTFLEKKRHLQLDAWGREPSEDVAKVIEPLVKFIDQNIPQSNEQYPTPWKTERQIIRMVNQMYMAGCLSDEFAELFRDLSFEELDACAKSFHFDECVKRDGLIEVLSAHSK